MSTAALKYSYGHGHGRQGISGSRGRRCRRLRRASCLRVVVVPDREGDSANLDQDLPHALAQGRVELADERVGHERVQLVELGLELQVRGGGESEKARRKNSAAERTGSSSKLQNPCKISVQTGVHAVMFRACVSGFRET